jgi:hypothetical protein
MHEHEHGRPDGSVKLSHLKLIMRTDTAFLDPCMAFSSHSALFIAMEEEEDHHV